jgi:ABC-type sulfate/molybdate transport systems ATPase subunit
MKTKTPILELVDIYKSFGLKLQKWPREKIDTGVDELFSLVHLEGLGDRTIDRISGGQHMFWSLNIGI